MALTPQQPIAPLFSERLLSVQFHERLIAFWLAVAAAIPVTAVGAIALVFIYESWLFFQEVPLWNFLTDTQWTPQFSRQQFGVLVLISATLLVTVIALIVAVPLGILAAIYLSEYAPKSVRAVLRPLLEALSGVPTIVYGYFALLLVTPFLREFIPGLSIFNSLSAGLVTGLLVTPIIAAFTEDALGSIDDNYRKAAYAAGLTRFELVRQILLPLAFPGIVASVTLAASRVLGETMIAAIAAGQNPRLTLNPLVSVETMTAFIVQVSLGDVPTDSLLFHTIFVVGMVLFLITLALNSFGNWLGRRYSKKITGNELPTAESQGEAATLTPPTPTFPTITPAIAFSPHWRQRHWRDRLFTGVGLLATLIGPAFLLLLTLITLRSGARHLNWQFLTSFTSRVPENAGILAGLSGTLWLLTLTGLLAVPIAIAAAIYLEEYMQDGPWSRFLEVNLANATAIPGILYGLLGMALFAQRLRWLTGGRTIAAAALMMTLLVLPLLVTATRTALRQVPKALKRGGYAVGMSRWQVIWHIVLPAARPGLITGLLLTASRVMGEASPLIALGAIDFITFVPSPTLSGLQSPFTTLTTQIFFWLSRPQAIYQEKAAAAVIVLGAMVLLMNGLAALLRSRLQKSGSG
ncbi:MAG TPA: phosphate ABC transporter permease PstA [Candidatus Obscuribacterales bacterium]